MANRLAGSFATATELELNRFRSSPFGELVWHLSTQMNSGLLAAYITVFYLRRDKRRRFITCLVYALVYPSIASNLMTVDNLSTRYDSVCTHTCSPFPRKPPLKVTQDGQERATDKLVARVKYILVLATPLAVDLRVG